MKFDPTLKLTKKNLKDLPPLCTDGAWGTELMKLGASSRDFTDLWNVEHPDKVYAVAKSYVDAGCQVILTNTFSSNDAVLEKNGLSQRSAELTEAGAKISKEAADGKAYVFGSIGPSGKMLITNEITEEIIFNMSVVQAKALEAGGVDAIIIETQSDLAEAKASLEGALSACDLPVGVSFAFDSGQNKDRTMMGVSIPQVYELAKSVGASFVGANCGMSIEKFVEFAQQFAECGADIPCWTKGNAGQPQLDENTKIVYPAQPSDFVIVVKPLLAANVKFMGGCCGSTPAHLKAMVQSLSESL